MFFLYSLIYTLAFVLLSPRFLFDIVTRGKYAAGFGQRLGFLPEFVSDERPVIWLHCVSVGETNAARPLVDELKRSYPHHRLIVSTTTKTGQKMARDVFGDKAEAIFYFPFDWRFSVRRALRLFAPSVVLLMETEIWFNFIREANHTNARICIVNGRLSERSYQRYSYFPQAMKRVLAYIDLALMQGDGDAKRILALGMRANDVRVSGNLKFDLNVDASESKMTEKFRSRFGISAEVPLILAASTHSPEEKWLLESFNEIFRSIGQPLPRLMIAPRHPERFAEVAEIVKKTGLTWVQRSEVESPKDKTAEVILLDSIGELRAAYPLAEIVFVGGSLIPHGGQSIFEPAAAGKAIVTGANTANFADAVKEFLSKDALIQLEGHDNPEIITALTEVFRDLLKNKERRRTLGISARTVMNNNRGAIGRTIEYLAPMLNAADNQ